MPRRAGFLRNFSRKEPFLTNWKQNLAIAGVLLAVDAFFLSNSLRYPPDSNTFPLLLSSLLGVLSLALAGQALWTARAESAAVAFMDLRQYRKVAAQVVLIAVFALIAPYIGYLVAGFLLCFATACNGGYPNRRISAIFSAGVSVFVFVVFKLILEVSLPLGLFFD